MILELLANASDTVGLIGVTFLLTAYLLISTNRISSQSLYYQLFNLTGAIFILFSLCFHFNLASFVIELAWITISLIGIYRITRTNKSKVSGNVVNFMEAKCSK